MLDYISNLCSRLSFSFFLSFQRPFPLTFLLALYCLFLVSFFFFLNPPPTVDRDPFFFSDHLLERNTPVGFFFLFFLVWFLVFAFLTVAAPWIRFFLPSLPFCFSFDCTPWVFLSCGERRSARPPPQPNTGVKFPQDLPIFPSHTPSYSWG